MPFAVRTAPAASAVPAGRVPCDLRAPELLLHTIQDCGGIRRADREWPTRAGPGQSGVRLRGGVCLDAPPDGSAPPDERASALWLWARRRRGDLVGSCQLSPGRVLLTCRIPREHVLLSEFSDWHNVLNGFPNVYLLPDEAVEDCDRLEAILDWYESAAGTEHLWGLPRASWPPGLRGRLESSWEGIFELGGHLRTSFVPRRLSRPYGSRDRHTIRRAAPTLEAAARRGDGRRALG